MSWDKAIKFTLRWEGGYVNHTVDKGGPTNRGITEKVLHSAYKSGLVKNDNIRTLSLDDAMTIYKTRYWSPYKWERYKEPVDMIMFDMTVNHGYKNAVKIAQRACVSLGKSIAIDGLWGAKTAAALSVLSLEAPYTLSKMLLTKRLNFYNDIVKNNPSQKVFLKGWRNRTYSLASSAGVYLN